MTTFTEKKVDDGSLTDQNIADNFQGINYKQFWGGGTDDIEKIPFVMQSPARYVQGADTMNHIGRYIQIFPSKSPVVLISAGRLKALKGQLESSFQKEKVSPIWLEFGGECTYEEVSANLNTIESCKQTPDSVISIGGGKNIDTGKLFAYKLKVPYVSCPTIASNDAPCSALCIMYNADSSYRGGVSVPRNPDLVVVDTKIIANAPPRFFGAGMGDALSTYYEALTCYNNPKATNMLSTRITDSALALAKLCADNLFAYGLAALNSVKAKKVTTELNKCVEANTLLSGVGFESGGLAASHAIAQGLSASKHIEANYMHGEMVSVGLVAHLLIEKNLDDATKCVKFFLSVGLPVCLNDLGFDIEDAKLAKVLKVVLDRILSPAQWFRDNMMVKVTAELLLKVFNQANRLAVVIKSLVELEQEINEQ